MVDMLTKKNDSTTQSKSSTVIKKQAKLEETKVSASHTVTKKEEF